MKSTAPGTAPLIPGASRAKRTQFWLVPPLRLHSIKRGRLAGWKVVATIRVFRRWSAVWGQDMHGGFGTRNPVSAESHRRDQFLEAHPRIADRQIRSWS